MITLSYCMLSKNSGFLNVNDNCREGSRVTTKGEGGYQEQERSVIPGAGSAAKKGAASSTPATLLAPPF